MQVRPHCSRKNSRSLSPPDLHSSLYLKHNPMLQTQMELAHSLISDLITRKEEHLSKFQKLTTFESQSTRNLPIFTQSGKKIPLSTHRFRRKDVDLAKIRENIQFRIRNFAEELETSLKKDLETHLMACFNASSMSEAAVSAWLSLLTTFESIDFQAQSKDLTSDPDLWTAKLSLSNLKQRLSQLSEDEKTELEHMELLDVLGDVSRSFRLLVKKVKETEVLKGFDELWTVVCVLFDYSAELSDRKIKRAFGEIERQAESEKRKIKANLQTMAEQWQAKIEESKRQNARLQSAFDHLQLEKLKTEELLKEREQEISLIRQPSEIRDFESAVGEITVHLEEMESRHTAQTALLESIGELINGKSGKKGGKRKDELGHLLVKKAAAHPGNWDYGDQNTGRTRAFSTPHRLDRPFPTSKKPLLPLKISSLIPTKPAPYPPSIPEVYAAGEATPSNQAPGSFVSSDEEETDEKGVQTDPFPGAFPVTTQQSTQISDRQATISHMKTHAGGLFSLLDEKLKRQPPMLSSNVFKLFELVMADKYRSDLSENEQGRPGKHMAEFLLDFLFMQQGLKSLVVKSLAALLNALEVLASKSHPYGLIFCRSLCVFSDHPFDLHITTFLTRAHSSFTDLQKTYKSALKSETEYGGTALLLDVAERLIALFPTCKRLAYEAVEKMQVPGTTQFDKVMILFCGRLAKIGRDFKLFFIQADPQKTGVLDESSFCLCSQNVFDICLSRSSLLELYHYLTPTKLRTSDIQKLPFKDWVNRAGNRTVSVTKCEFLSVLSEIYWMEEEKLRVKLRNMYESRCKGGIRGLEEFKTLVGEAKPGTPEHVTAHLYREAVEGGQGDDLDVVTKDAFCEVGVKYRLGCGDLKAFMGNVGPLDYELG